MPFVKLHHKELGSETKQPLSAARNLLESGWEPADAESAELLGVKSKSPSGATKATSTKKGE